MENLKEQIKKNIKSEGKINCSDALDIAEELGISPSDVGDECNKMNIKVKGCQLGCFK